VRRLLALLLAALVVGGSADPASAHGDEVQLEVVEAIPSDVGSSVLYRVELSYVNDGDPISGATVTATASLPNQPPAAPVAMEPSGQDGVYEATVSFPETGNWTVQFDAGDPVAQLRVTFDVEPPPPTTAAPATTAPETPASTTAPSAGAELADDDEGGDSGPPAGLIVGLVVTGLLAVAGGVLLVRQRRRTVPAD
jgi:hypothetical protein